MKSLVEHRHPSSHARAPSGLREAVRPSLPSQGLVRARVTLRDADRVALELDAGGSVRARRAASCLLEPSPGDRVLVSLGDDAFVLAVLERAEGAPAEVVVDGQVRARGALDLQGEQGVSVTSRRGIELRASRLSVRAGRTELWSHRIDAVAAKARASLDELSLVTRAYDVIAERITERAARIYRFVSELDQLRARHFDYRAEHSAQIKGETTLLVAREVAKIDGEQIHIG